MVSKRKFLYDDCWDSLDDNPYYFSDDGVLVINKK